METYRIVNIEHGGYQSWIASSQKPIHDGILTINGERYHIHPFIEPSAGARENLQLEPGEKYIAGIRWKDSILSFVMN